MVGNVRVTSQTNDLCTNLPCVVSIYWSVSELELKYLYTLKHEIKVCFPT